MKPAKFRYRARSHAGQLAPASIIEGLYLGELCHARSLHILNQLSITHVVNAASEADCFHGKHTAIKYLHLPISDNDLFNISDFFKPAIQFIHQAISSNGAVLVHCVHGVSRAPSLVIAYLVAMQRHSLYDALAFIKIQRPRIKPNRGFWHQLLVFSDQNDFGHLVCDQNQNGNSSATNSIVSPTGDQFKKGEISSLEGQTQFGSIYAAEIIAGLYLGDPYHACDAKFLREARISHILNAAAEIPTYQAPTKVTYLHLHIRESSNTDITDFFTEATAFIEKAIRNNGRVLVHSNKGMSRSVALVLAYLSTKCGYSVFEALSLTKTKRPRIMPNPVFWRQLLRFAQRKIVDSSMMKENILPDAAVACL